MSETMNQNARQEHKGGSPSIYGQQDASSSARDNTGQHMKDTRLIIGKKIKSPTQWTGFEGKDSTEYAMVTDTTM